MIITARNVILAASIALVVAAAPALAQNFVIDGTFVNPDGTNGPFTDTAFDADGTSVLMTEGSSIDVSDAAGDNAVQATGNDISIEVRGALSAQGDNSPAGGNGILVDGDDAVIVLTETGTITTGGDDAYGQYIVGNDGTITNAGTITTGSDDSLGQFIEGDGGTLTNTGMIMTGGDDANGQYIDGDGGTLANTGAITTGGDDGHGQRVDGDDATILLTETGSITTVGLRAYGQFIQGTGGRIENAGTIMTAGEFAGGQRIEGDFGTITNAGTIETGSDDARGQYIFGNDGTITNAGTITTGGQFARGQYIDGDDGTITNTGAITTGGQFAHGQWHRGDDGTITNTGTVTTGGDDAYGQYFQGDDGTITNTGTIITGGEDTRGQWHRGDDGTITNTGAITTAGDDADGQSHRGDDGEITNTGTITTRGEDAHGQYINGFGGSMTNSGVVETGGVDAFGQFMNGSNGTITNSGRLVSRQAAAIRIEDTTDNNTINLWAPGFIGGAIDFSDEPGNGAGPPTNTTVNIVTGMSQSILWTLEGDMVGGAPDISGSVPWFYNAATQTVATFDPTLVASETAALGDLISMLSHVGLGALEGFEPGPGPDADFSALGYVPVADSEADTVSHRVGRAWATVLGGQMNHAGGGTTLDSTIGHIGIAAGYTWQQAPNTTLSAMTGYVAGNNKSDARWSPSFDHDTHTLFAGLHGEHQLNRAAVQFGLTAGHSWIDHNRFVNDNLAPLGESWVSADYGGFFVSPELALSTDILLQNGMTLTPNAGLRYAAQWLGGYSETGAVSPAANATVEDRFVGTVEARAGLDITRSFTIGDQSGTLTGGIGYLGRWGGGDDDASITLNGVTQSIASGHQDLNAVTVSATLLSDIGETGFLELDANYLVGDTAQGFDGRLTMGMAF